jgi:hypothetical protein
LLLRTIAAATLVLSLGACVQCDYLVAGPTSDAAPAAESRYIANTSYITSVEIIPLRIDPAFPANERREILRAVEEWNHVLNGYVRFDTSIMVFRRESQDADTASSRTDSSPPRVNVWAILPVRGATPIGLRVARPMALMQPTPHGGGVVMIDRDHAGAVALAAAVRHELGHVLGLLHDPASRLMSPVHDPAAQRCIDKAAVASIAEMRGLPLAELNWCEEIEPPG